MDTSLIEKLARLRGVGDAYHDYRGELRYFSSKTRTDILRAMGCAVDDATKLAAELSELEIARWRQFLPDVATARGSRIGVDINIPAVEFGGLLTWTVDLEKGGRCHGTVSTADCTELWRGEVEGAWVMRRRLELPVELPPGYHDLQISLADRVYRCPLIMSPLECYEPPAIVQGKRLWGVAVQLYSVRSRSNWGIGDFSDLLQLIRWLAPQGAGFIGLNPLHALAPADPARCSPYSASSRHFLNVLYIAIPAVPEFLDCAAVQARVGEPRFAAFLNELRAVALVDYLRVAAVKFEILELLFRDFCERHLNAGTARALAFRAFVAGGGRLLQLHARFDALDRHFSVSAGTPSGWLSWPEEYRDVDGAAARQYAASHAVRIEFFVYLQWLAHDQLKSAQALTRELHMPIGLYGDYAVGSNPSGSETWVERTSYRMGAEIGAPPDPLALRGQGWGIPPQDPIIMQKQQLQGFMQLIRNNMRYYGALRLDHVMSLCRLWWVAAGDSPSEGAYVHYPLQQLLSVLALESVRGSCLIVGEDLGVVPDEMRRAMPEFGLYHYKVLLFEKIQGRFRRPSEFVARALGTVTTHDMPTLRAYWEGRDIELRSALNLYPSLDIQHEVTRERSSDRVALLTALDEQSLLPAMTALAEPFTAATPFTQALTNALHVYLARSSTALVALQIEDILGMTDPVNVPGTDREYPNWQRKLIVEVEDMVTRRDIQASFAEIGRARRYTAA